MMTRWFSIVYDSNTRLVGLWHSYDSVLDHPNLPQPENTDSDVEFMQAFLVKWRPVSDQRKVPRVTCPRIPTRSFFLLVIMRWKAYGPWI